jgi:hypothetical protein
MKNKLFAFLTLALLSTLDPQLSTLFAQGTAFTYQGRLNDNGNPASGSYDVTFRVWNAASGPAQVGGTLTNANTAVSNGLFTVTLDFGANFPGADRWLEIGVRTNGNGTIFTLKLRQAPTRFTPQEPARRASAEPFRLRTSPALTEAQSHSATRRIVFPETARA